MKVRITYESEAKTKFAFMPASVRIYPNRRAKEDDPQVTQSPNSLDVPKNVIEMIQTRLNANANLDSIRREASAMLTLPIWREYQERKGFKRGWLWHLVKDKFNYELACQLLPK